MVARCVPVPVTVQVQAATSSDPEVAARDFATARPGYLFPLDDPPTPEPLVLLRKGEGARVVPGERWITLKDVSVSYRPSFGPVPEDAVAATGLEASFQRPADPADPAEAALGPFTLRSWYPGGRSVLYVTLDGLTGSDYGYELFSGDAASWLGAPDGTVEERAFSVTLGAVRGPGGTIPGYLAVVSGTVAPGRLDYAGAVPWDQLYSPATGLRRIAYMGDYAAFSAPSAASPLRGEAVAYLLSGLKRVFEAGPVGAVYGPLAAWEEATGAVVMLDDTYPDAVARMSSAPGLDLFRLRRLRYLCALRPSPPAVTEDGHAGSSAVAFPVYDVVKPVGGSEAPAGSDPPAGFPEFSYKYRLALSQAELDANGGDWVVQVPAEDRRQYAAVGSDDDALLLYAARRSAAHPVPCPLAGPFARGYAVSDGVGSQAYAEPLAPSDVASLFARPEGDPASATRAWALGDLAGRVLDPAHVPGLSYSVHVVADLAAGSQTYYSWITPTCGYEWTRPDGRTARAWALEFYTPLAENRHNCAWDVFGGAFAANWYVTSSDPWFAASGASSAGAFRVPYAYASSPVPRVAAASAPTPLDLGRPVPEEAPDDVAACLVATVRVEYERVEADLSRRRLGWAGAAPVSNSARWTRAAGSAAGVFRGRSPYAFGPADGSEPGPSDLLDPVRAVLAQCVSPYVLSLVPAELAGGSPAPYRVELHATVNLKGGILESGYCA